MSPEPADQLEDRIARREQEGRSRGLLAEGVFDVLHLFSHSDTESLDNLKDLVGLARVGVATAKDVETALAHDDQAINWRNETALYTTTFAKAVPLFMARSGKAYAFSGIVNGLDQIHSSDSGGQMIADLALGTARGVALKYAMDRFAESKFPLLEKGAALGGTTAFLDTALTTDTWYDRDQHSLRIGEGLIATVGATGIGMAAGTMSFPLGSTLGRWATARTQSIFGKALSQPLVANMATGWGFGFASGATNEFARQLFADEKLDPVKLLTRAAGESVTDMFAGGTGYKFSNFSRGRLFAPESSINRRGDESPANMESAGERAAWLREQPSRILDLAAKLSRGREVDARLLKSIEENADLAKYIDPLDTGKFLRTVLVTKDPVAGLDMLMKAGAMKHLIPELAELTGKRSAQDPIFHPEGNVWEHTTLVLRQHVGRTKSLPAEQRFIEMVAALFHDVSKPETQEIWPDGGISNKAHDLLGAQKTPLILARLGIGEEVSKPSSILILDHMKMHETSRMNPRTLNRILRSDMIEAKIRLQASDSLGTKFPDREKRSLETWLTEELSKFRAREAHKAAEPKMIITGGELHQAKIPRGPVYSEILDAARLAQLDGTFKDADGAADWLQQKYDIDARDAIHRRFVTVINRPDE